MATAAAVLVAAGLVWLLVIAPLRDANHLRLPAQQQVQTTLPKLGVHTRLTDEVEQSKIQRTFEMARQMGAAWDVEYVPWNYVQPTSASSWDWSHTDLVVNHAVRQGLRLIVRVDSVPDWARPALTGHSLLTPEHYADFARFVSAFAQRYRGKVAAYVIWNEPNVNYEWGYRAPDPAGYAALLKAVYPAVKTADPSALVLAAPLAPNLDHSAAALDDLDYLQQLYDAGAKPYFDGLAAHTYGWQHPPDDPPSADTINFRRVELERQVMVRNGDAGKQVYVTETGWNDFTRWVRAVSPADRVTYTVNAVKLASQWDWLAALCIWDFRLPTDPHNYNDGWSLVNFDFSPSPTYVALQRLATPDPPTHWQPFTEAAAAPSLAQRLAPSVEWAQEEASSLIFRARCLVTSCHVPPDISLKQVQDAGTLRVVMDASFPPLESVQADGQLNGVDVTVARDLGAALGVRVQITNMSSDGLKDAVLAGKADAIVSSFQAVPEWKKELAYSRPYYWDRIPVTTGLDAAGAPVVTDETVAYVVAVRAGRNQLLNAINGALDRMRRDGRLPDLANHQ